MLCIPKELIDDIKKTMKSLGAKRINEMSFQEIKEEIFKPHLKDEKSSLFFAKTFSYALASDKIDALDRWFKTNLSKEIKNNLSASRNQRQEDILQEYKNSLAELKDTTESSKSQKTEEERAEEAMQKFKEKQEAIIENILVKGGVSDDVLDSEVKDLMRLTEELSQAKLEKTDNLSGYSDNYYKKYDEIQEYLNKSMPMPAMEQMTKLWSRGVKLFSISSPFLNVVSNFILGVSETTTRAITNKRLPPILSSNNGRKYILNYVKEAINVYNTAGIDITRSMLVSDKARQVLGESYREVAKTSLKDIFNKNTSAKKIFTGMTYALQRGIFHYTQGVPDIWSSAYTFADSLWLQASKIADREGLTGELHQIRTEQLFKQAANYRSVEELQREGDPVKLKQLSEIVGMRQIAVQYALKSTGQEDTEVVKKLLQLRTGIDKTIPALNLGTMVFDPFVKTPINFMLISAFDYSPLGFVKGLIKLKGKQKREAWDAIVRAGLGSIVLAIFLAWKDDDEYMNAFDLANKKEKALGNYYNSILYDVMGKKIALSVDFLSNFKIPVAMGLSIKKSDGDSVIKYVKENVISLAASMPVVDNFANFFEKNDYVNTNQEHITAGGAWVIGTIYSALIPSIWGQAVASFDGNERQKAYDSIFSEIQTKIPNWRQDLQIKQDKFGDPLKVNPFLNILFGARVKELNDTAGMDTLKELSKNVANLNVGVDNMSEIKALKKLKETDAISSAEYEDIMFFVKAQYGADVSKKINSPEYEKIQGYEEKQDYLNKDRKKVIQNALKIKGIYSRVQQEMDDKPSTSKVKTTSFKSDGETDEAGFINQISLYAKAIGTDPATAFDMLFKGETIKRIDNKTIIVNRMNMDASQAIKIEAGKNNPDWKLDHTIPLQLGGSNSNSNLKLVSTDEWKANTPVENYLGKKLRAGTITKQQAQDAILAFKNKTLTFNQIKEMY